MKGIAFLAGLTVGTITANIVGSADSGDGTLNSMVKFSSWLSVLCLMALTGLIVHKLDKSRRFHTVRAIRVARWLVVLATLGLLFYVMPTAFFQSKWLGFGVWALLGVAAIIIVDAAERYMGSNNSMLSLGTYFFTGLIWFVTVPVALWELCEFLEGQWYYAGRAGP